ncbi:hypothetical protein Pla86_13140 [Planctomycetes bacterium Pla86]|uniref:Uncharacterized protein n=1 Tax=Engelhardtia mirabilis TaxID=2528011 RepID=A0A518BGY3_9BACT|nr:hypothetical protein Pla133_13140 [Planctomycetes bacterium Pla133]QDV00575.1 hypothetical protein Pla86_13140 [Planctomycetes bacterium Pla86]
MDDSLGLANEVAAELLGFAARGPSAFLRKRDVFLADVELSVERFRSMLYQLREAGVGEIPCLIRSGGDPVAIDWSTQLEMAGFYESNRLSTHDLGLRRGHIADLLNHLASRWFSSPSTPATQLVSSGELLRSFSRRLVDFLQARFDARRSDISGDPGMRFTVHANRNGLRVFYSPAYFVCPHTVFGSPTSPVVQWLQPGRYIFALEEPGGLTYWDHGEYDVPPRHTATLSAP